MRVVKVQRTVERPVDVVFERLTNHEAYRDVKGVRRAELLRPGTDSPRGAGALRLIDLGLVRFEEEILALEPPRQMDYRIISCNLPFEHEFGRIAVEPLRAGVTHVLWVSRFRVPRRGFEGLAAKAVEAGFQRIISAAGRA